MPENKSPWGSGGKPSGGGKKPESPFGSGGRRPGQRPPSGNRKPNDLENVIQGFKDKFGGGSGGGNRNGGPQSKLMKFGPFGLVVLLGLFVMLLSSFYIVSPKEKAVVLRFGEYSRTTVNGLHFKLPTPFETVIKRDVTTERNVGDTGVLVLTRDENIVDVNFNVIYRIKGLEDYVFSLETPDDVVSFAADSALREVIGQRDIGPLITDERGDAELAIKDLMQEMLDEYQAGVIVTNLQLQSADVPPPVISARNEVVEAQQDREKFVNEGQKHRNKVTEEAIGKAAVILQEAEAYKQNVVAVAKGEADRFTAVYKEYKLAPQVTRQRIYLETMEEVYKDADKIIMDGNAGSGVVPYLPLNELNTKKGDR